MIANRTLTSTIMFLLTTIIKFFYLFYKKGIMPKISIVTDTDASLPPAIANAYNVRQVPICIHFGEEVFESGVDIDDRILFERVDHEKKLPSTAAPTPGKFAQVYQQAFDEDGSDALVCFCINSAMSATLKSAQIAAEKLLPERNITVVDTQTLSMVQAFMVIAAAEAAQNGADVVEVVRAAKEIRNHSYLYGALATLKYLSMSGRVSHVAAGMAGMLNIKPILSVRNGKLEMLEKVRTRKKAWRRMIELAQADLAGSTIEKMAILHVDAPQEAEAFKDMFLQAIACPDEILMAELTPGLSVHTGAKLVGVSFVKTI